MVKYLLFFTILLSGISYGQTCAKNFRDISRSCIQSKADKFDNLYVTLDKVDGGIYFYKNSSGDWGKLHVYAVLNNTPRVLKKNKFKETIECVAYFKFHNLSGRNSQFSQGDLVINFDHGQWGTHGLDLSGDGSNDLVLKNDDGYCVLESANGAVFSQYRKELSTFKGQGSSLLYWTSFFLIGLAVFLVALYVFEDNSRFQAAEALEEGSDSDKEKQKNHGIILKYSRPFFKRYFSPIVAGMKNRREIKEKYKRKLATAGLTKDLPPEDFYAFKLFLIIGFPIVFLVVRTFIEADWSLTWTFVLAIFGYFYPDIWLGGLEKQRQQEIVLNMPFVVDMLALSIEAGLDFIAAIAKVLEKAPPSPLVDEFEILLKEIRVGSSRAEALRQFSWRNQSIVVSSFCATLISADSVGASIGPILKTLGKEMRQKRSAEVEKKAAAAATKMLLPMMAFILPAILIIIMAPMVLQFFAG